MAVLDKDGLSRLWANIKAYFVPRIFSKGSIGTLTPNADTKIMANNGDVAGTITPDGILSQAGITSDGSKTTALKTNINLNSIQENIQKSFATNVKYNYQYSFPSPDTEYISNLFATREIFKTTPINFRNQTDLLESVKELAKYAHTHSTVTDSDSKICPIYCMCNCNDCCDES